MQNAGPIGKDLDLSGAREFVFRYVPTSGLRLDWLIESFRSWFDEEELSRLSRLQRAEDRRDYAAAHALLRATLSAFTGIHERSLQFAADRMGKPYLRDGGPSFSLTHCRGLAACAVTRAHSMRRIGVDAEPLSSARKLESIIDDFANTREREWLRRQGRPLALVLVELWTAKEAVLKARGTGLATADGEDALQTIHCEFLERTDCDATRFAVENEYTIHCWQLASGHVLSLAVSPPRDDEAPLMPQEHDLGASGSSGTTTPS